MTGPSPTATTAVPLVQAPPESLRACVSANACRTSPARGSRGKGGGALHAPAGRTFRCLLLLQDLAGPGRGAFGHVDDVFPLHLGSDPTPLGGNGQALLLPAGQGSWGRGAAVSTFWGGMFSGDGGWTPCKGHTCALHLYALARLESPIFPTTLFTTDCEPRKAEVWASWLHRHSESPGGSGPPRFSVAPSLPRAGSPPSPAGVPSDAGWGRAPSRQWFHRPAHLKITQALHLFVYKQSILAFLKKEPLQTCRGVTVPVPHRPTIFLILWKLI